MAQQVIQLDQEKLSCSICLDLLKDPVTIPCGHSYCMSCIQKYWDEDDKKVTQSCPQCRQGFTPRPVLVKNTMLAELVDELKKAASPAGTGDVVCDFCTGKKLKALKSCLVCLASYCELHVQPHYKVAPLKKHKLVEATLKLQENICSRHDEVLKIFCRTDQQCICYLCSMDGHKGHDTISVAAERAEREEKLGVSQQKIQQRIQDREKDVKVLQQKVKAIESSADKAVNDSEKIFTDLIHLIEKKSSEMIQQIRSKQKTDVSQLKEHEEKLQLEIAELEKKAAELEQLSHTEDHHSFFSNYPSVSHLTESADLPSINLQSQQYFQDVTAAVSRAANQLQDALKGEWTKNTQKTEEQKKNTEKEEVLLQKPQIRRDFLKWAHQIILNPITANMFLSLSNNNRKATLTGGVAEPFWLHPEQFVRWWQVLSIDGLIGRCYWEVKLQGTVLIAVAYGDICRRGTRNECGFGNNNKSWALECRTSGYTFKHNNIFTPIVGPMSSRIGVYLDHSAGILSFYSLTTTMNHLITVKAKFTKPLYPGFWFPECVGDSAEFCELK